MYSKTFTIDTIDGLHARPATKLVNMAKNYQSDLEIINGDFVINPKSILSMLAGELRPGSMITLRAAGSDEWQAVEDIYTFISNYKEEL